MSETSSIRLCDRTSLRPGHPDHFSCPEVGADEALAAVLTGAAVLCAMQRDPPTSIAIEIANRIVGPSAFGPIPLDEWSDELVDKLLQRGKLRLIRFVSSPLVAILA